MSKVSAMYNITVVTVCRNAKEDLEKTITSVLKQSYKDMEYLIIDGVSTDGSVELIKQYAHEFALRGISFRWVSESDTGTYDAMNKGAKLAKGKWLNYMNAGDTFYSETTLEQIFVHDIPAQTGVLYGDTWQQYDFGAGVAREADFLKSSAAVMPFCHQSCLVLTKLMQEHPFDTTYRIIADHDFFYRLRKLEVKFVYLPIVIAAYNAQYGLSANNPLTLHVEKLRVYRLHQRWYYPFLLLKVYLRYGWIAGFKKYMPSAITNAWMKHKRRAYIQ